MTANQGPSPRAPLCFEIGCRTVLFVTGVALIALGSHGIAHADVEAGSAVDGYITAFDELDCGVCAIFAFLEGAYGALLTTMAGISAIVAAGFSNFKMAYNMMIVSLGCFILRSMISLYYGNYLCLEDRYPSTHGIAGSGDTVGCSQPIE